MNRRGRVTVGLAVMASDEELVIGRMLESVRGHVDFWTFADTGSTDSTMDVVLETMQGTPGAIVHQPWVDYGANRTAVLRAAAEASGCDYTLHVDADDSMRFADSYDRPPSREPDAWYIETEAGRFRHHRLHLFRTDVPWEYYGKVHEFPRVENGAAWTAELLEGPVYVQKWCEGKHSGRPGKFESDALVVEEEWRQTGDPRWLFMLGQSWEEAGDIERACRAYERRARHSGGWQQERYVALLRMGKLTSDPEPLHLAYELDCTRVEAPVWAARVHRERGHLHLAELFAQRAAETARRGPSHDAAYDEQDCWAWRAYDELALALHKTGRPSAAAEYGAMALEGAQLGPSVEEDLTRLEHNLEQYRADASQSLFTFVSK